MDEVLAYSGGWLDRAADRRGDPQWVAQRLSAPEAKVVPMWRDACLVRGDRPVTLPTASAADVIAAGEPVFLGLDDDAGVFAVDLSTLEQEAAVALADATQTRDVRGFVGQLTAAQAATLAYARGLLHWHRHQHYCGACGTGTDSRDGGHLRVCRAPGCAKLLFPRIEPAVIVLVEAPGTTAGTAPARCLLGRRSGAAPDSYAVLAGFVEVGESLEDAVRREVAEEAGVTVDAVHYQASQAWPFPAGLMVGFRARAVSEDVTVDNDELAEARWFTRAELRQRMAARGPAGLLRVDSIEAFLIEAWLRDGE